MSLRTASVGMICVLLSAASPLGCSGGDQSGGGFTDNGSAATDRGPDPGPDRADVHEVTPDSTAALPTVEIEQPEEGSFHKGDLHFAARVASFGRLDLQRQVAVDGVSRPGVYGDDISFTLDTANPDHWSFLHAPEPSSALADGQHSFSVSVSTSGGDTVSDSVLFRVDNVPPLVLWESPTCDMVATGDVDVRLSLLDQGSGLERLEVRLDGAVIVPLESHGGSPGAVKELTIPTDGLAAGQHLIDVQVSDVLGNRTTSSCSFFIDEPSPYVEPETYQVRGPSSVSDALIRQIDSDPCHDLVLAAEEAVLLLQGRRDEQDRCVGRFGGPAALTETGYTAIALEDRVGPDGAPDGVLDLVGVRGVPGSSSLRVQMGTMDPALGLRFGEPVLMEQRVPDPAVDVILGDLDGDGISDAIVRSASQDLSIALLAGTADGAFSGAQHFAGVVGARRVLVADFSADGALDVAVALEGKPILSLFPGEAGSLAFGAGVTTVLGAPARVMVLGDVFADSPGLDIVLSYGQPAGEDLARVVEVYSPVAGEGGLSYERSGQSTQAFLPIDALALADLDGDGGDMLDVAALSTSDRIVHAFSQSEGPFPQSYGDRSSSMYVAPHQAHILLAADLNDDTLADLIAVGDNAVSVLRSRGLGVPLAVPVHHLPDPTGAATPLASVTDVRATKGRRLATTTDFVGHGTRPGAGGGVEHVFFTILSGSAPTATDAHGWTRQEALLEDPTPNGVPLGTPIEVAVGDLDMDGADDVFLGLSWPAGSQPVVLAYVRQLGGSFTHFGHVEIPPGTSLRPPDSSAQPAQTSGGTTLVELGVRNLLPASPRPPHLVLATADPAAMLFFNPRAGAFAELPGTHVALHTPAQEMRFTDLDDDGATDIVALQQELDQLVFLLSDSGTQVDFEPPRLLAVGESPSLLEVADMTRDGEADLLVVTKGGLAMLRGKAGGLFEAPETIDPDLGSLGAVDIHDVNGDTRPDIVGLDEASEELVFLLSTPDGFGGAITSRTVSRPGKLPSGGLIVAETTHPGCPHVHVFSRDLLAFARHLHQDCF